MYRPRVVPVLLLRGSGLVKSRQFKDHRYIGDPLNAVRLFNELKADELIFLDIAATGENRSIPERIVRDIGEEAHMPFAVGGGLSRLEDIHRSISAGAEKVVIGTAALENPDFIRLASERFGSSAITVCIDFKAQLWQGPRVYTRGGRRASALRPVDYAKRMQELGAGELILQSVSRDGTMAGYDVSIVKQISEAVDIPVVALGGAGSVSHMQALYREARVSGVGAGSLFVYHGPMNGVLINYPQRSEFGGWFKPDSGG